MRLPVLLAFARPDAARRGLAAAAIALALTVACGSVPASASPGLIVIPQPTAGPGLSYFKLSVSPGSRATAGSIALRNTTHTPLRVTVEAVAGKTIDTLGSAYAPPGTHTRPAWLHLTRKRLTLHPGVTVAVPVSVSVPTGAQPGDMLAGVSVEAGDQRAETPQRGVSIASVARYVIGVEVTIPGPRRPAITFTGAALERTPSALTFDLLARNSGNVILQGVHGAVRVLRGRRTVLAQRLGPGTFVTNSSIAYPVPAPAEHPDAGTRYRVIANLRYPGGIARLDTGVEFGSRAAAVQQRYTPPRQSRGSSTPWWPFALLVAALAYGAAMTFLLLRKRRRSVQNA